MSKDNQIIWRQKRTIDELTTENKQYARALNMRLQQMHVLCLALENLIPLVDNLTEEDEQALRKQVEIYKGTLPHIEPTGTIQ